MKICVIGGGLGGATAARMFSHVGDVTLFEKNDEVGTGSTNRNWGRIHTGSHYPHKPSRGRLAMEASAASARFFADFFQQGTNRPQYYVSGDAPLKFGDVVVTPKYYRRYVDDLATYYTSLGGQYPGGVDLLGRVLFEEESPTSVSFPRSGSFGVRTNERVVDLGRLVTAMAHTLLSDPRICVRTNSDVAAVRLQANGRYLITTGGITEEFDLVVDAARWTDSRHVESVFDRATAQRFGQTSELRIYAVANLPSIGNAAHQYTHGQNGISYALMPHANNGNRTGTVLIEVLPDSLVHTGDADIRRNWELRYMTPGGESDGDAFRALAGRILGKARREYPALEDATLTGAFAAPMMQPEVGEHEVMREVLFRAPAGERANDFPKGFFSLTAVKLTDTVVAAIGAFQGYLVQSARAFGGIRASRITEMTAAEFTHELLERRPDLCLFPASGPASRGQQFKLMEEHYSQEFLPGGSTS